MYILEAAGAHKTKVLPAPGVEGSLVIASLDCLVQVEEGRGDGGAPLDLCLGLGNVIMITTSLSLAPYIAWTM